MLMDCIPTLNSFVCCGHYFIYGAFLGDETSAIDYLLPNDGLLLISCFCYCFAMDQEVQQSIPLNPRNVPIIKEGDQHVSNFSLITLFFSASYFSTYLLLGIVLEIATLLPITNYLMNFGGIFHEKQSLNN